MNEMQQTIKRPIPHSPDKLGTGWACHAISAETTHLIYTPLGRDCQLVSSPAPAGKEVDMTLRSR